MKSTSRDRSETRRHSYESVLDVTTELFSRHGYAGTSVRTIASALGIESGSLYSHISSKEEVLRDIIVRCAQRFFDRADAARSGPGTPKAILRNLCRAHLSVVHEHNAAVQVYYDEWPKLSGPLRNDIIDLRNRYESIFESVVRKGIQDGEFQSVDVRWTTLVVLSTLNWTYKWYSPDGPMPPDQVADQLIDVVLVGLNVGKAG